MGAPDERRGLAIEPPLGVDLPAERLGVLAAAVVHVARPPAQPAPAPGARHRLGVAGRVADSPRPEVLDAAAPATPRHGRCRSATPLLPSTCLWRTGAARRPP